MSEKKSKRILIVAIRAIGDVVLITPIIQQIRNAFPDAYVAVLADGASAYVLHHNPHIDRIFMIDRRATKQLSSTSQFRKWLKFILELRCERFDTVIDLFSGPRSAIIAWLSKAKHRYGEDVRSRIRGYLYNHAIHISHDQRHLIEQKFALIQPMIGTIPLNNVPLELYVSREEVQQARSLLSKVGADFPRLVALVPGAGSPWRIWPPERFAKVGDVIVKKYHAKILLMGGENDKKLCRQVYEMMREPSIDLSGKTSLRNLIAILAELDLVISNLTGPMHIASALPQPKVIGLYGAADTIQYAPWSSRVTMVTKGKPEEAYWKNVDYEYDHKRLLEISVEDVLEALPPSF